MLNNQLEQREIKKVCVLGSGVMGAQIAIHFANINIPVHLLDMPTTEGTDRNAFTKANLKKLQKQKPKPFYHPNVFDLITCGNFEDDLNVLKNSDWIIEAIVENLDIKKSFFDKIKDHINPHAVISTNTSGISINQLAEMLPENLRPNFLGAHFFNPVRYMRLLELIPSKYTSQTTMNFVAQYGENDLGKGIVYAKDTPNFIANRIGVYGMMNTIHHMIQKELTIEEVDTITGRPLGRPKSATFRTADIVGLDTFSHVAKNIFDGVPDDEERDRFVIPDFITKMITDKRLGSKSGQGFYKKVGNDILTFDVATNDYRPKENVKLASVKAAKEAGDKSAQIKSLYNADDKAGEFTFEHLSDCLLYTANRVPEISDDIANVDRSMQWGFNWDMGPFEVWDAIGVSESVNKMKENGRKIPEWIESFLSNGNESFYKQINNQRHFYDIQSNSYKPLSLPEGTIQLKPLKSQEKVVDSNSGASLIDLGDGVLGLEFHSKMNAIGDDILSMAQKAVKLAESEYRGILVANEGSNFSVGANIMLLLMAAQEEEWDELDDAIRDFQNTLMRLKYCNVPVVSAPFGMALGGGCEVCLHTDLVNALTETYMGLVEMGVGLIPAGGGTKEMLIRNMRDISENGDPFPAVQKAFETIGLAKVAESAALARDLKFLLPHDRITMNKDHHIRDAKRVVIGLAESGYTPPTPERKILAMGEAGYATLCVGLYNMREGNYISDYDVKIGQHLAKILCGGTHVGTKYITEQDVLDLERDAFLSLMGEEKTQDRIVHMLQKGKPLRN